MAYIIVEKGSQSDIGKKYTLGESTVVIGRRNLENSPDITFNDEFVSRRHAEICFDENSYKIRDLNSTNRTSLDGVRIEPGEYYPLKDNVTIGLGITPENAHILLRFRTLLNTPTTRLTHTNIPELSPVSWLKIGDQLGEIWVDEKQVNLTRQEYRFIIYLHKRAGNVCTREELISEVWPEVQDASGVSNAAIDQLVRRLRLKIETNPSRPVRLISRKGFGYMIV